MPGTVLGAGHTAGIKQNENKAKQANETKATITTKTLFPYHSHFSAQDRQ